jgi:uncharacterized protein YcbX
MEVTGIFIYPIKATAAIPRDRAEVRPRGLAGDRRWVVVDEQGQFLQQRVQPKMALIRSKIEPNGTLWVEAPGMVSLHVPVPSGGDRLSATIWRDTVDAAGAGSQAAAWFSEYLGLSCRLAFMDDSALRPVDPQYGAVGDQVSFADAMPLLLATDASLADLNRRMDKPLPMSRFRPNVVVDGVQPWDEDNWKRLRIGDVEFEVTHRCARCVVTTIDQVTGEKNRDGEPLKTLATFRRHADGVYFGQNLVPRSTGIVQVGDEVEILYSKARTLT